MPQYNQMRQDRELQARQALLDEKNANAQEPVMEHRPNQMLAAYNAMKMQQQGQGLGGGRATSGLGQINPAAEAELRLRAIAEQQAANEYRAAIDPRFSGVTPDDVQRREMEAVNQGTQLGLNPMQLTQYDNRLPVR